MLSCCKCGKDATLVCTSCGSLFCWDCHKKYGTRKYFGAGICANCGSAAVEAKGCWYPGKQTIYICSKCGKRHNSKD